MSDCVGYAHQSGGFADHSKFMGSRLLREILDFARPLAVYAIQSIFAVDRYAACSWPCRARRYSIAAKASKILRICGAL